MSRTQTTKVPPKKRKCVIHKLPRELKLQILQDCADISVKTLLTAARISTQFYSLSTLFNQPGSCRITISSDEFDGCARAALLLSTISYGIPQELINAAVKDLTPKKPDEDFLVTIDQCRTITRIHKDVCFLSSSIRSYYTSSSDFPIDKFWIPVTYANLINSIKEYNPATSIERLRILRIFNMKKDYEDILPKCEWQQNFNFTFDNAMENILSGLIIKMLRERRKDPLFFELWDLVSDVSGRNSASKWALSSRTLDEIYEALKRNTGSLYNISYEDKSRCRYFARDVLDIFGWRGFVRLVANREDDANVDSRYELLQEMLGVLRGRKLANLKIETDKKKKKKMAKESDELPPVAVPSFLEINIPTAEPEPKPELKKKSRWWRGSGKTESIEGNALSPAGRGKGVMYVLGLRRRLAGHATAEQVVAGPKV